MIENLTYRLVAILGRLFAQFADGTLLPVVRGADGEPAPLSELLALAGNVSELSDDDLATLDADITAAAEAAAAGDITDEVLAEINAAAAAVQAIRAEAASREAATAERAANAAAALAAIRGEQEGEDDGEGDEAPAEEASEVEVNEQAPVEPVVEGEQPMPVAAAARRRPPLTRTPLNVPRPAAAAPVAAPTGLASLGLVAAANAPGVTAGAPIRTYDDLAAAFVSAYNATKGYRHGARVKVPVIRAGAGPEQYPDSHYLDSNMSGNMAKIARAQRAVQEAGGLTAALTASANSQTASGGICAPQQVRYDLPVLGSDARPVRDQLMTRFGADRGGIATLPIPVLGDVAGAVDNWTEANDQNPSDPSTKPCLTVTCPDPDSDTVVEAITRCIETGNFRARYFPEQVEAWMRLVATAHARFAEERLLAAWSTGSKAVTTGTVLGTVRDVLAGLDRAISVWRYVHRDDNITLDFGAPMWLRDQIRTDIARQLPVGSTAETLAVADATIAQFFAARGVSPTWILDGESGQRFNVQGVGPLQGWPSTVKTYLAPSGGWLFLDGGTLDLGLVRDSTLNSTNDVQFFAETFEGAHFHGVESWTLAFDTCPDGSVSAAIDIAPCTTGS